MLEVVELIRACQPFAYVAVMIIIICKCGSRLKHIKLNREIGLDMQFFKDTVNLIKPNLKK